MKRKKGARKGGFRRMLTRSQYQKLQHAVGYKLRLAGFDDLSRSKPPFHEVHAAFTSTTCSACGHNDKANRQSQAEFVCTNCGHTDNADLNAAANIASKGQHFDEVVSGRKKGDKLKEYERWSNWRSSKAGPGRENGLVLGSATLPDARMSELSSPYGQDGSKVTAEKKRDDASSSDREHNSVFNANSDQKLPGNKAVQHDLFQKG